MISAAGWSVNQPNTVLFVLVDSSGNEVTGLGSSYALEISKLGSSFSASAGTKSEVGNGWYKYVATSGESDTYGPVAVKVTGAGIIQQNLEYVVGNRVETAIIFTYTVTSIVGSTPIEDVKVYIYSDSLMQNIVWIGETDVNGVARDAYGDLPRLTAGTYYIWRVRTGFVFQNPDTEVISV